MRGGRYKIGVGNGRWVHTGGDKTGDMRDVGEQVRADAAGDLTHTGEVDDARVSAGAYGDHLGFLTKGDRGEFVVIDQAGIFAHSVLAKVVEFAGEVGGVTVGEVAPVAEVHPKNFVAGLEYGSVDGSVSLSA